MSDTTQNSLTTAETIEIHVSTVMRHELTFYWYKVADMVVSIHQET